ncbi:MAG: YdcF family protein [Anaerolineales bacterium]
MHSPVATWIKRLLAVGLVALLLWAIDVGVRIHSFSLVDGTTNADVAIVLGAGTRNGRLSAVFRERIDHAIDLYRRGVVRAVILTGGVGSGQQLADSEVARSYVLEQGIPAEVVFIETNSEDTVQNLEEAQQLMTSNAWESSLIVSDPLHMYRAMLIANDLDLQASPSPTPTSRISSTWANAWFLIRETILVMQFSLFG